MASALDSTRTRLMSFPLLAFALLLSLPLIGCGGGGSAPIVPNPTPIPTPTPHAMLFSVGISDISTFEINNNTGALRKLASTPWSGGALNHNVVSDPAGRFLYVPNWTAGTIDAFSIDPAQGTLTSTTGFTLGGSGNSDYIWGMAVSPTGKFLLATEFAVRENSLDYKVLSLERNTTTGALTQASSATLDMEYFSVSDIVIHPGGRFVFAACGLSFSTAPICAYSFDPDSGALARIDSSPTQPAATQLLALDPQGKYLYGTRYDKAGTIYPFEIDTSNGTLTPLTDRVIDLGRQVAAPVSITIDPTGRFLFAINSGMDKLLWAFAIDRTTGRLTAAPGSPYTMTYWPELPTVDPSGRFLYFPLADAIAAYSINQTTGALTPVTGSPFASDSVPIAVLSVNTAP